MLWESYFLKKACMHGIVHCAFLWFDCQSVCISGFSAKLHSPSRATKMSEHNITRPTVFPPTLSTIVAPTSSSPVAALGPAGSSSSKDTTGPPSSVPSTASGAARRPQNRPGPGSRSNQAGINRPHGPCCFSPSNVNPHSLHPDYNRHCNTSHGPPPPQPLILSPSLPTIPAKLHGPGGGFCRNESD